MTPDQAQWTRELREFIQEQRGSLPAHIAETDLDTQTRAEYRVELGFVKQWLVGWGPRVLQKRAALLEQMGRTQPNPIIVLRGGSNVLLATRILVGDEPISGEGPVVALLDTEYETFVSTHREEPEFAYHVVCWSRFVPADQPMIEQAQRRGLEVEPESTYRNHINGTLWGERAGLEVENLWCWDGERLELVSEGIRHRRF